jgi:hypothetical protein
MEEEVQREVTKEEKRTEQAPVLSSQYQVIVVIKSQRAHEIQKAG